MPSCAAVNCKNRRAKKADRLFGHSVRTFHKFPQSKPELLSIWLKRMRRDKFVPNHNSLLCSKHFEEHCFDRTGQTVRLRDSAVPTLFDLSSDLVSDGRRRQCAAYQCSYNTLTRGEQETISLHLIPKDPARRRQWAIAIRRRNADGGLWMPWFGEMLCDMHFKNEDFECTGKTVHLKEGVTPSVFNYTGTRQSQQKQTRGSASVLSQEELDRILEEDRYYSTTKIWPLPKPCQGPQPRKIVFYDHAYHQASNDSRPARSQLSPNAEGPGEAGRDDGSRSCSPSPSQITAPEPLDIPAGHLYRHLSNMKTRHHRLVHLQSTYRNMLDKIQFRSSHREWWSEKTDNPVPEKKTLQEPLLTLRSDKPEDGPPVAPVDALSRNTLLPLTPNEAWKVVAALREELLDLQVALMNSRIQTLNCELRVLEAKAAYKSYKVDVKEEQKQEMQARRAALREELLADSKPCLESQRDVDVIQNVADRNVRRAEALVKRLEKTFTPMQMRAFRTGGKKMRWVEEDIRRAIQLKAYVSHRGYKYIRQRMGIPLPTNLCIRHGVKRYTSLKPLYDEMLARNKKTIPKSMTEKDGDPLMVKKRKLDEVPMTTDLELMTKDRPVIKRYKKQPLVEAPQQQPRGQEVELASHATWHDMTAVGISPRTAYVHRRHPAGERVEVATTQRGWVMYPQAWETEDEESMDEETLEEITRPQESGDMRDWSVYASGLR